MPPNGSTERSKSNRELEWTEFYEARPLARYNSCDGQYCTVCPKGKCPIVLKETV
jgi:hypothetical protein